MLGLNPEATSLLCLTKCINLGSFDLSIALGHPLCAVCSLIHCFVSQHRWMYARVRKIIFLVHWTILEKQIMVFKKFLKKATCIKIIVLIIGTILIILEQQEPWTKPQVKQSICGVILYNLNLKARTAATLAALSKKTDKIREVFMRAQGCNNIDTLLHESIHCNENPIYVFLFWELRGLSPNFHIHVSVSDLNIPRIGQHISGSRISRPVIGIYV
jgi:hypothetical protein